jgi:hypothetical protein
LFHTVPHPSALALKLQGGAAGIIIEGLAAKPSLLYDYGSLAWFPGVHPEIINCFFPLPDFPCR